MAIPFDDATTLLTSGSATVRQIYHDRFEDMYNRNGATTNRLFPLSKRKIQGDGINIQARTGNLYGARMSNNINADFHTPRAHSTGYYKVTYDEAGGTGNHFRRLALSLQTSHMDIKRVTSNKVAAEDWVEGLLSQSADNISEALAIHRHLDSTGKLAAVTGTVYKNDAPILASCSAKGATGGVRFAITGGSLGYFPANATIDVYTSANVYRHSLYITDVNPSDQSVGCLGVNSNGDPDSTVDVQATVSGDLLYFSGEYLHNWLSIGHWFSVPSSGESFFGRDRTSTSYRWMATTRSSILTASTPFSKTHLDQAAIDMGYVMNDEDESGYVNSMQPELEQAFRDEVGNDIIIQYPTGEQKGEIVAAAGFNGALYRHPRLGRMILNANILEVPGLIRMLRVGDWETLTLGSDSFDWLPGDGAGGSWYRMSSSTPGAGKTTTYRMDGFMAGCDVCLKPREQCSIGSGYLTA